MSESLYIHSHWSQIYSTTNTGLQLVTYGWLGGTTGSASDQRSEGCGFEAY